MSTTSISLILQIIPSRRVRKLSFLVFRNYFNFLSLSSRSLPISPILPTNISSSSWSRVLLPTISSSHLRNSSSISTCTFFTPVMNCSCYFVDSSLIVASWASILCYRRSRSVVRVCFDLLVLCCKACSWAVSYYFRAFVLLLCL